MTYLPASFHFSHSLSSSASLSTPPVAFDFSYLTACRSTCARRCRPASSAPRFGPDLVPGAGGAGPLTGASGVRNGLARVLRAVDCLVLTEVEVGRSSSSEGGSELEGGEVGRKEEEGGEGAGGGVALAEARGTLNGLASCLRAAGGVVEISESALEARSGARSEEGGSEECEVWSGEDDRARTGSGAGWARGSGARTGGLNLGLGVNPASGRTICDQVSECQCSSSQPVRKCSRPANSDLLSRVDRYCSPRAPSPPRPLSWAPTRVTCASSVHSTLPSWAGKRGAVGRRPRRRRLPSL